MFERGLANHRIKNSFSIRQLVTDRDHTKQKGHARLPAYPNFAARVDTSRPTPLTLAGTRSTDVRPPATTAFPSTLTLRSARSSINTPAPNPPQRAPALSGKPSAT